MDRHDIWFFTCVPNFSNRCMTRTPRPRSHTWRTLMVPDWLFGGEGHSWHHGSSIYVIFYLCAEFQLSCMNRSVSRTPRSSKSLLGGRWWFLTGYLDDGVILDIMDGQYMWFLTGLPNFSSLAWIEVCQEPPVLEVILEGRWRFLTGVLEDGVIHLWCPRSSWQTTMKCCPESFIKIWLHLDDILASGG